MSLKGYIKRKLKSRGFIFRDDIEKIRGDLLKVELNNYEFIRIVNKLEKEISRQDKIFDIYDEKTNYIVEEISELQNGRKIDRKKTINDTYILEKKLFDMYQCYEYRFFLHNIALNTILYENEIKLNQINGSIRLNFNPKVSIIIPVYNGSNYLKEAIESAINQTYANIEIIIVNDGSSDDEKTEKIALSYMNKYKKIIKYYSKENGGVSSALNFGIKKMTGEYFAWLSHDDIYYKNNIEEHINYLKNNNDPNVITYTCFDFIDEKSQLIFINTIFASNNCSDYKMSITKKWYNVLVGEINGGSVLIPVNAFSEFGLFNETEKITQEKDMWSRLMKKYRFVNIPKCTTAIRCHSEQVTIKNKNIREETDKKIVEILNSITNEEKIEECGSVEAFNLMLKKSYMNNGIKSLETIIESRLEKYKNEKN